MIKNLRPNLVDNFYSYFFNWDEIIKDESQQKRVINYIKYEFKVDLRIAGNSFEEPDVLPVFSKSKDDKIIIIETQSKDIKVSIEKTRYNNVEIILNENNEKKIVSLKIKNDKEIYIPTISFGDPFDNFMNMIYRKRPFFLDIIYTDKIKKRKLKDNNQISRNLYTDSSGLNYENETIDVVTRDGHITRKPLKDYVSKERYQITSKNFSNPQYQTKIERVEESIEIEKYFLNIRGLILYILGKIDDSNPNENEDENQKESSKNREKYRKNISDVLANLSQNYSDNFPFLLHYKRFKEILKDIIKNHQHLRYYDVDILITIAKELKSQIWFDEQYSNLNLDTKNNALINYWIVKRYSNEITHYLAHFLEDVKENDKEEFLTIFREYQNKMLTIMLEYLKDEQKSAQDLLDEYNRKMLLISSK